MTKNMKKKILIADDEICWLTSHKDIIELIYPGIFDIEFATSAKEALKLAEAFQPDLLITDMQMEDVSEKMFAGEYLIQQIHKKFSGIEVIIISGASNVRKIANRNNISYYIPKYDLMSYPVKLKLALAEIFELPVEIC